MDHLLNWLHPEVQRTLKQLMASVLAMRSLVEEQASLKKLVAAVELVDQGHTSLTEVLLRLHAVLVQWERSFPDMPSEGDRQTFLHACQTLCEFSMANAQAAPHAELCLYSVYSELGQMIGVVSHPVSLWPKLVRERTLEAILAPSMQAGILDAVQQRALHISHADRAYGQAHLHAHVLTLLRNPDIEHPDVQAALASLQIVMDAWLLELHDQPQSVAMLGLFHLVLTAYQTRLLKMDMWLKRLFLAALGQFQSDPFEHLLHASFYSYLAWQEGDHSAANADIGFLELPKSAQWHALKGARYDVAIFGQIAPKVMDDVRSQIERAKIDLARYGGEGGQDASLLASLTKALSQLASLLTAFHPSAEVLSYVLQQLVTQAETGLQKKSLQVELATTLLIVEAMLAYPRVQSTADAEHRWHELARRLRCAMADQPTGVFAPWMYELQQNQARHHTNEQVVAEMKTRLLAMERSFQTAALDDLAGQMTVLHLIAQSLKWRPLEQAAQALAHLLSHPLGKAEESLIAANLAAMGLFVDMQGQSRGSAEALFVFDDRAMQLRLQSSHSSTRAETSEIVTASTEIEVTSLELQTLFFSEARELLDVAQAAHHNLRLNPADTEQLVVLRRAFHTLKGSARMVSLPRMADIAWQTEQALNQLIADREPISSDLLGVIWQSTLEIGHDVPAPHADPLVTITQPPDWLDLPATKVIGELSISLPLYNAYLSEADEWSRHLATALSEWQLDSRQPLPATALTWAHALAGSSATVGFTALSQLAKWMELVIERVIEGQLQSADLPTTLELAANDVCRLLHQFAAGFIKEPAPGVLSALEQLLTSPPHVPTQEITQEITHSEQLIDADLVATFAEESTILLPQLGSALRLWLQSAALGVVDLSQRSEALRALHTLKGSARLVGQQQLGQLAHELESAIESYAESPSSAQGHALLQQYDALASTVTGTQPSLPPAGPPEEAKATPVTQPLFAPAPATQIAPFVGMPAGEVIRVKLSLMDRLVNQSGEILIARARMDAELQRAQATLTDMTSLAARFRDQLRELELQTESQMQSRQTQFNDAAQGFDPLELDRFTRTQELVRFMAESLSDMSTFQRGLQRSLNATEDELAAQARLAKDLQRHLLQTRMVPFDAVAERLHRLVRMASQELGKQAELTITGGIQELDRSVLERVTPAFEHLLRNAIVHGIESTHDRIAIGKDPTGRIRMAVAQNGNDVLVTVEDDGQGLDEAAVLARAQELDPALAQSGDPAQLIFLSGLSTAATVSELAGRGIGMDVVRAQVLALGGRIEVHSQATQGTRFELFLPLTTAVTQIVLVRTGTRITGLPANLVQTVLRVKEGQIQEALKTQLWTIGEQTCPFYSLSQLLQYPASEVAPTAGVQALPSVLILSSASRTLALCVDEVLGSQEVVVKNLGAQLARMPGLAGMTVLPTGPTVLIYNPVALATVYGARILNLADPLAATSSGGTSGQDSPATSHGLPQALAPLVMVVDDSITMRRVLQRLLLREGYRTAQAADGKQALDMLRIERPALVLSDVEMPRMDGFELLKQIRLSERLQDLPVVMITSRMADKHRDHAKSLGANEYLGKPYPEEELLALLHHYAGKVTA